MVGAYWGRGKGGTIRRGEGASTPPCGGGGVGLEAREYERHMYDINIIIIQGWANSNKVGDIVQYLLRVSIR
jgi:hypothetical protein